jgi:ABC-2 type transport system ATP-binding protein
MTEIKDLHFSYKRHEPLFTGVNLTLPPGNIYGLLGKNGAGKTTLLKIIAGLLFPKEGSCTVSGYSSASRSVELLKEIFFLPEEFYVPQVSADTYRKLYSPFYPRFSSEDFEQSLSEFDIGRKEILTSLSYGQKKKFLIAFGLATDCRLFILDEPTNGLDIPSKSQFRRLVAGGLTEDRTFLISTHQVRDMQNLIDPIIILDSGSIVFMEDMYTVATKLAVKYTHTPPEEDPIYMERILDNYTIVTENSDGKAQDIDLELLFNAVIGNRERLSRIFA